MSEYTGPAHELARSAGQINGDHAKPDWTPLRYVNRNFGHATLTGFYRLARIGLVTPLRDGMNLVAKEFVAAQDEADPGVLVLSSLAGAAIEMTEALIVNPHDLDGVADAIATASAMPLAQRIERWRASMDQLQANDSPWRTRYLRALDGIGLPAACMNGMFCDKAEQPVSEQDEAIMKTCHRQAVLERQGFMR